MVFKFLDVDDTQTSETNNFIFSYHMVLKVGFDCSKCLNISRANLMWVTYIHCRLLMFKIAISPIKITVARGMIHSKCSRKVFILDKLE